MSWAFGFRGRAIGEVAKTATDNGKAWAELPEWCEALNRDFRYQLTSIGGYAPVDIAEKVAHNRFKIAGGRPGMKVSWQVTGMRQDPFANGHRIPVQEGPKLYGQPRETSVVYGHHPAFLQPEQTMLRQLEKTQTSGGPHQ